MNCDQAFEYLTDRSRCDSPELHAHWAICPRCRQMRETLSPALASFGAGGMIEASYQESDSEHTLDVSSAPWASPEPHAFLSLEAVHVAEAAARQLSRRHARTSNRHRTVAVMARYAAVFIIGMITVADLGALKTEESTGPLAFFGHPGEACTRPVNDVSAPPATGVWVSPEARKSLSQEQAGTLVAGNAALAKSVVLSCMACHIGSY